MPKTVEYIRHYIGPVFFVNKKSVTYSLVTRNIESCSNPVCTQHQKPVLGLPFYCTNCGSPIKLIRCEKSFENTPTYQNEQFFDKCCSISHKHFNGTDYFMGNKSQPILDVSQQLYVPKIKSSEFTIVDDKTVGTYCINEDCKRKHYYTDSDYNNCPDCGHKLVIYVTHNVNGPLSEEATVSLFDIYTSSNYDSFQFIENIEWQKMVDDYTKTESCKDIITDIEKAYGVGCVSMRLAFVSYHSNY